MVGWGRVILLCWRGLLNRVGVGDSFALEGLLDRVGEGDVRVLCECCGGWGRCRCAIFSGGGEMT